MTERTSLWGLRLLAIFTAVVVWFFASGGKREKISEKLVDAAVTFNSPRGLILLDPVQTVKVRLRGPDRRIRNLAPYVVDVVVDLTGVESGQVDINLGEENVLRPDDVSVVSIEPNTLRLRIDRETTRQLPVLPRIVGEPAAGAVPHSPSVNPPTATVSGPSTLLAGLESVTTSPVSLDGHAFTFQERVPIVPPDPLIRILEPSVVIVGIQMDTPGLPPLDDAPSAGDAGPAAGNSSRLHDPPAVRHRRDPGSLR